ncbi:hypothetical protein Csa_017151 [Cucumis sativus]|nr:hypothetical protein Csa_017151 [Cucumis sativus]
MQAGKKRELETEGKSAGATESSDHDIHIWTERERRKKMRNMFSNLHALLPHLPPKADKSSIVDEAVNYIKTLQETFQRLHKQKVEKLNNNNNNNNNPSMGCSKIVHHPLPTTREAFLADQASSNDDMSSSATLLSHLSTTITPENVLSNLPLPSPPSAFQTWTSSNLVLSVCGRHAHFCVCSAKKPGLFAALCYVLDKYRIDVVSAHVSSDVHQSFFMIQAHVSRGYNEFGAATVAEDTFKEAAGEIIFWLSS